jgi:hypothetical protein
MGPRSGLDAVEKIKHLSHPENRNRVVQLLDYSLYRLGYPSSPQSCNMISKQNLNYSNLANYQ